MSFSDYLVVPEITRRERKRGKKKEKLPRAQSLAAESLAKTFGGGGLKEKKERKGRQLNGWQPFLWAIRSREGKGGGEGKLTITFHQLLSQAKKRGGREEEDNSRPLFPHSSIFKLEGRGKEGRKKKKLSEPAMI